MISSRLDAQTGPSDTASPILMVTYNDYPAFEGLGTRIYNLSRVLREHGHEVVVFAPNIDKRQPREEWKEGVRVVRVDLYVPAVLARIRVLARAWCMLAQSVLSLRAYRRFFKKEPPRLILAEQVYSILPALVLRRLTGAPVYVDDIGTVSELLREMGHVRLGAWFTAFEKILFARCQGFIHTSEVSRRYYAERGAQSDRYVPNGVDCDLYHPAGDRRAGAVPVVFLNGSAYSTHNLEAFGHFIAIGRRLRDMGVTPLCFRLSAWPACYLPPSLQEEIAGASEWLDFSDGIADLPEAIREADAVVLPYSEHHGLTGGARLKALEYMACGKLLIATAEGVAGIEGLLPGTHYLHAAHLADIPALLARVLASPGAYQEMGTRARGFVLERYDWRVVAKPLLGVLSPG